MTETQSASRFPLSSEHQPNRVDPVHAAPTEPEIPPPLMLRLHEPLSRKPIPPPPVDASSSTDHVAERIVDGVLKAAHRLRGLLSGHFSEFDLTDVRYAVLKFLRESEPYGCTQSAIAEHLDQSESSISTLVKRMRKSELLYRLRSGIDKRKWVLKLTDRGGSLLETARQYHAERMNSFLRAFDSDERLNLTGMLNKLVAELTPREQAPKPSESLTVESPAPAPAPVAAEVSISAKVTDSSPTESSDSTADGASASPAA